MKHRTEIVDHFADQHAWSYACLSKAPGCTTCHNMDIYEPRIEVKINVMLKFNAAKCDYNNAKIKTKIWRSNVLWDALILYVLECDRVE